ncbi:selina-4(15),7(11)-diene synthase [Kitasatospora sp. NPDC051853]|uniref:selina-4(15),7(11)-diene synthase n=1 Tax=Kitasatospora sp. NPDC051853 TaxID=3364058 RepID=UPI0037BA81F8
MSELTMVPPIYSPYRPAVHPSHERIDRRTADWAEAFSIGTPELRGQLARHSIGTFAARILPTGREEMVSIVSDSVFWLFGVDDGYCEGGELGTRPGQLLGRLSQLLRVAQNPEAPMLLDDPLAAGLRDLSRRLDGYATPGQLARWVDALREYFLSVGWEAEHRSRGVVPGLNDYTLMRIYGGAASVVLRLLEMGHGEELPPHERDRTDVRAAAEMAYFVICWDNDLFSHHKESRSGGYYLNVIRVLEQAYGLTTEQAVARAIAQRDRVLCLFVRLCERLRAGGSPQLRQYVGGLEAFIRGSQDWGISSLRYTTPDDPAELPSAFTEFPTDSSRRPLDIPAVSWWWDLDPESSAPSSPLVRAA